MLKAYYTFRRFEEESKRYRRARDDAVRMGLEKKIKDVSAKDQQELVDLLGSLGLKRDGAIAKVDREKTFYRFSSADLDLFYEHNMQFIENVIEETATFVFSGEQEKIEAVLNEDFYSFLRERGYIGGISPWEK